jgi:hypothetical protein
MARRQSRLIKTQEKKNIRKAFLYIILTILILTVIFFLGLPTIVKFSAFLTHVRQSSEPVEKKDTTSPIQPRISDLPVATNKERLDIKGTTEPGATVILFINNKESEILANSDGEFLYTLELENKTNTISAISRDSSGNESPETESIKVIFDDTPPETEITKPDDSSEFFGTKQRQVVVEGKTEDDASLKINERVVVVENDGTFSFAMSLNEGENILTIITKDKAGNTSEQQLTLYYYQ